MSVSFGTGKFIALAVDDDDDADDMPGFGECKMEKEGGKLRFARGGLFRESESQGVGFFALFSLSFLSCTIFWEFCKIFNPIQSQYFCIQSIIKSSIFKKIAIKSSIQFYNNTDFGDFLYSNTVTVENRKVWTSNSYFISYPRLYTLL